MNKTSINCHSTILKVSFITQEQLAVLNAENLVFMLGNLISNAFVIFILNKTKQIANITYKLIFMLSVSDLMGELFAQTLLKAMFYVQSCLVVHVFIFVSAFALHLSVYIVAIIGVDRYLRIKHYARFKTIWTTKVVISLILISAILALFQAAMTISFFKWKISYRDHLYCDRRYHIRYNNIPSNVNYANIKCLTQWITNCILWKNQQEDYKIKFANHIFVTLFSHTGTYTSILRSIIEDKVTEFKKLCWNSFH